MCFCLCIRFVSILSIGIDWMISTDAWKCLSANRYNYYYYFEIVWQFGVIMIVHETYTHRHTHSSSTFKHLKSSFCLQEILPCTNQIKLRMNTQKKNTNVTHESAIKIFNYCVKGWRWKFFCHYRVLFR